jgi:hypothetical protein
VPIVLSAILLVMIAVLLVKGHRPKRRAAPRGHVPATA